MYFYFANIMCVAVDFRNDFSRDTKKKLPTNLTPETTILHTLTLANKP